MMTFFDRIPGRDADLRTMLLRAGVGQFTASMSIPYMNMLPSTTDPYAQGVSQLVAGLQRLLNKRGANLAVDGGMGERTAAALERFAGPRWGERSWAQLYGDVLASQEWSSFDRNDRGLAGLGLTEDEIIQGRDALLAQRSNPSYCSVGNPQPGCTAIPGVAKPMTASALATFKLLQQQLNRCLFAKGKATIGVDGRIGPSVLKALATLRSLMPMVSLAIPSSTVDQVAASASSLAASVKSLADSLRAPASVTSPVAPASMPRSDGGVQHPPDSVVQAGLGAGIPMPILLGSAAVAALLLFRSSKPKRKRK
jgi:lysozyme family protein